ncbi:MAG: hypothetical protein U0S36_14735 [Candidatus Nanopelagicales bacterium]
MERTGGRRWVGWIVNAFFTVLLVVASGVAIGEADPAWRSYAPKQDLWLVADRFPPTEPGMWRYVRTDSSFLWPSIEIHWQDGARETTTEWAAGPRFLTPALVLATWIAVTLWRSRRRPGPVPEADPLSDWDTRPLPPVRA